jgi:hypothetical protein
MKTVVLCGSKKFKKEIRDFGSKLKEAGVIVYEPYLHEGQTEWANLSDDYKKYVALGLTHDHFYKIKMADVVYVYNKEGYSGVSTTMEIGYAAALSKPIYALSRDDQEICKNVLFREIILTPQELLKKLN